MASRDGNYSAFYVSEPFNESGLGAHATKDFVYYNMLRAWKGDDSTFPFNDSHNKNYNVRDTSDWELTLKPRIRERIRHSKNIILFLSSLTKSSKAIREVAKPSPEIVQQIAIHFGLTSDIVNFKDRSKNPGILFMKKSAKELTDHTNADLLKAKDEMIFELKERIKALEKQNSILLKQFEK